MNRFQNTMNARPNNSGSILAGPLSNTTVRNSVSKTSIHDMNTNQFRKSNLNSEMSSRLSNVTGKRNHNQRATQSFQKQNYKNNKSRIINDLITEEI